MTGAEKKVLAVRGILEGVVEKSDARKKKTVMSGGIINAEYYARKIEESRRNTTDCDFPRSIPMRATETKGGESTLQIRRKKKG